MEKMVWESEVERESLFECGHDRVFVTDVEKGVGITYVCYRYVDPPRHGEFKVLMRQFLPWANRKLPLHIKPSEVEIGQLYEWIAGPLYLKVIQVSGTQVTIENDGGRQRHTMDIADFCRTVFKKLPGSSERLSA